MALTVAGKFDEAREWSVTLLFLLLYPRHRSWKVFQP
jgi:hypothetical protein